MKTHLIAHHSLTKDGETVSWDAIRRYHTEVRGWQNIGYHLGIERIGGRYEALLGRPFDQVAAAAREQSMNFVGIHVCFVGNFDELVPDDEMFHFACPHLAMLMRAYAIPLENVIGHRDVASYKSCPGKRFDMDRFRGLLGGYLLR